MFYLPMVRPHGFSVSRCLSFLFMQQVKMLQGVKVRREITLDTLCFYFRLRVSFDDRIIQFTLLIKIP